MQYDANGKHMVTFFHVKCAEYLMQKKKKNEINYLYQYNIDNI